MWYFDIMSRTGKINVVLRELICQKIGSERVKCKFNTFHFEMEEDYPNVHPYTCYIDFQHKLHM